MAMRITTKMTQNTSLNNLNTNKALQEKLTQQLSTMKKITRPSDDPVIAIRSLKLNSSLNKIEQYYKKNSEDAESWLELTESAIKTTTDIITNMQSYINQCANGYLETSNREAILENLSNLVTEIYATGNADSAGRSLFTGYRTDYPLTFTEDKEERYSITEQRTNSCLDTTTFVRTGELVTINEGNFNDDDKTTTEYQVESYQIARIRLAYEDLDYSQLEAENEKNIGISYLQTPTVDEVHRNVSISTASISAYINMDTTSGAIKMTVNGNDIEVPTDGTTVTVTGEDVTVSAKDGVITFTEENPTRVTTLGYETITDDTGAVTGYTFAERAETTLDVTKYFDSATDEAYEAAMADKNAIVYIAETGELLLGSNIQEELSALTLTDEIRLSYDKSQWQEGDLDPIHYFYTKTYDDTKADPDTGVKPRVVEYNAEKLTDPTGDTAKQIISYDIGSNQTIRVNTTADEVFTHDIGRDIDELLGMIEDLDSLQETQTTVKNMIKSEKYEGDELAKLETELAALEKAITLQKDKVQKTCEGLETNFKDYLDQAALAQTNVGSRESRLTLIQNRLNSQQTNYKELVSENEDADVTDLAIQLSSVELTYEAALSSISYVMQTTLLDFI